METLSFTFINNWNRKIIVTWNPGSNTIFKYKCVIKCGRNSAHDRTNLEPTLENAKKIYEDNASMF